jgi:hypothetical protein
VTSQGRIQDRSAYGELATHHAHCSDAEAFYKLMPADQYFNHGPPAMKTPCSWRLAYIDCWLDMSPLRNILAGIRQIDGSCFWKTPHHYPHNRIPRMQNGRVLGDFRLSPAVL